MYYVTGLSADNFKEENILIKGNRKGRERKEEGRKEGRKEEGGKRRREREKRET
jgi:hypothetical protein